MKALNYEQGSEDWLRARAGVITASRYCDAREKLNLLTDQQATYVAALKAGLSQPEALAKAGYKNKPTASAIDQAMAGAQMWYWGAKAKSYAALVAMETISREPLDDTFVTYAMRRGRELEPQSRNVYQIRTGAVVEEVSLILTDDERFGYSADGLVDDDGLVEIKVPMACDKLVDVWANPQNAHLEYIDQINGGLWVTGRKWCDLVIYCPWLKSVGKDLFIKRIHRDDNAIEALESDLLDFMRLVDENLVMLRAPAKMSGAPKEQAATPPWNDPAHTHCVDGLTVAQQGAKADEAEAAMAPAAAAKPTTPEDLAELF